MRQWSTLHPSKSFSALLLLLAAKTLFPKQALIRIPKQTCGLYTIHPQFFSIIVLPLSKRKNFSTLTVRIGYRRSQVPPYSTWHCMGCGDDPKHSWLSWQYCSPFWYPRGTFTTIWYRLCDFDWTFWLLFAVPVLLVDKGLLLLQLLPVPLMAQVTSLGKGGVVGLLQQARHHH